MRYFLTIGFFFIFFNSYSQCSIEPTSEFKGDIFVCKECACPSIDSLYMNIPKNTDSIFFDNNMVIERGVQIDLTGTNQTFVVPKGDTVIVNGDFLFTGSGSPKSIVVEGVLIINGTLDLENQQFEIDGTGSIDAETIIGADNTTCVDTGDGTCPVITADNCEDGTTGDFCTTALPVELLFFKASAENNAVKLTWATATEENFDYFTLERSTDARNYEALVTIEGTGWSESVINYSYTDNHPLNGRSYYRLKATDLDETYEYFQPVMVNFNNDKRAIRLDNNPVGDEPVKFKLNFAPEGDMEITITNVSGLEVYRGSHQSGLSIYSVDAKLDNGMYLIKVKTQEGTYTARFLKK